MPIQIKAVDRVPQDKVKDVMEDFAAVDVNILTVINDGQGTFSVEGTFIDPGPQGTIILKGKMSHFGGPNDHGVTASEGLALFDAADLATAPAGLFLPNQPPGTTGLARRLNPNAKYLACRWNYTLTPKGFLRSTQVTVSAKGKSVAAQPVDFGPAIETGRIADLSLGLADILGLDTDDTCSVAIPLPGGANIPIPPAPPVVTIDLAAIDAKLFPPDMSTTLVVMTTSNDEAYWVLTVLGQNESGQTLRHKVGNNPAESLLNKTVILPLSAAAAAAANVPPDVAAELNKAVQKEPDAPADPAGHQPGAGDDINAKVFAQAHGFVNQVTSNVPGTEHGKLACAWAVNEVVRLALGKPINTENGGTNGLSTAEMFDILRAHHTRVDPSQLTPGLIVISPTQGTRHGHVGIVGGNPGGAVGNTQIFSNSSHDRRFEQNYTVDSWTSHFNNINLQVLFFALNPNQFT
jgi:hypothetical protein